MSSVIHYHFRGAKANEALRFDGASLPVSTVESLIRHAKRLTDASDIELRIVDVATRAVVKGDVGKNSDLIVTCIPRAQGTQRPQGARLVATTAIGAREGAAAAGGTGGLEATGNPLAAALAGDRDALALATLQVQHQQRQTLQQRHQDCNDNDAPPALPATNGTIRRRLHADGYVLGATLSVPKTSIVTSLPPPTNLANPATSAPTHARQVTTHGTLLGLGLALKAEDGSVVFRPPDRESFLRHVARTLHDDDAVNSAAITNVATASTALAPLSSPPPPPSRNRGGWDM